MSSLEIKLRSAPRVSGTVQKVAQGAPGGYYIPALAEDGKLAWTPSAADMPAVIQMELPGGVTSWNDLQGRPFGEEKIVIEWDRDISAGMVEFAGTRDLYLGYEGDVPEIATGKVVTAWMCFSGGPSADNPGVSEEVIATSSGDGVIVGGDANGSIVFVICTVDGYSNELLGTLPKKGVYFKARPYDGSAAYYIYKLEWENVAQLDPKYIPSLDVTIVMGDSIVSSHTGAEIIEAAKNGKRIACNFMQSGSGYMALQYDGCAAGSGGTVVGAVFSTLMWANADSTPIKAWLLVPNDSTLVTMYNPTT